MTKDQAEALDKARKAALSLKLQADKARVLGLTVLEQWLREASVGCQAGADFQVRAMGDNLSTQTQRVVVDSKPKEPPTSTDPDVAEAIADAMKRKGLV